MLKWLLNQFHHELSYGKGRASSSEIVHANPTGATDEVEPQELGLHRSPHRKIYDGEGQSLQPQW